MFGLTDEELVENLERMRQAVCGYWPGDRCDCKFGADRAANSEATGCPELRQAIAIISGQREEVIIVREAFERSAKNTLAQVKYAIDKFYEVDQL